MPRLPNSIHGCGECDIELYVLEPDEKSKGCATIDLLPKDDMDSKFEMFFRNLDQIREFHRKLGAALEKHLGQQPDGTFKVERIDMDADSMASLGMVK